MGGTGLDLFNVLFSFSGRIPRGTFWIATALIALLSALGLFAAHEAGAGAAIPPIMAAGLLILSAIATKRLHDINITGWWLFMFYVFPAIFISASIVIGYDGSTLALSFFGLLALIAGFGLMGWRNGTHGDNPYGPDPIRVRQQKQDAKRHAKLAKGTRKR